MSTTEKMLAAMIFQEPPADELFVFADYFCVKKRGRGVHKDVLQRSDVQLNFFVF